MPSEKPCPLYSDAFLFTDGFDVSLSADGYLFRDAIRILNDLRFFVRFSAALQSLAWELLFEKSIVKRLFWLISWFMKMKGPAVTAGLFVCSICWSPLVLPLSSFPSRHSSLAVPLSQFPSRRSPLVVLLSSVPLLPFPFHHSPLVVPLLPSPSPWPSTAPLLLRPFPFSSPESFSPMCT